MTRVAQVTVALAMVAIIFCSCGRRVVDAPAPPPSRHSPYLELQPGWRLVVVAPQHTGGNKPLLETDFQVTETPQGANGNNGITLTAKAPDSFGYVRSIIALREKAPSIAFQFARTEHIQGDVTVKVPPSADLRRLFPKGSGYVRMLFLTRVAAQDHDMAILRASTRESLDTLTNAVLNDPRTACRSTASSICEWVPAGVAVRAEMPSEGGSPSGWKDVF